MRMVLRKNKKCLCSQVEDTEGRGVKRILKG